MSCHKIDNKKILILYFFQNSALLIGNNNIEIKIHRHHLMEIFISLNNSFKIKKDNRYYEAKNIIVHPDEPHQIDSDDNLYVILLLDSESTYARQFKKIFLNNNRINILPDTLFLPLFKDLKKLFNKDCKIKDVRNIFDKIIYQMLGKKDIEVKVFDPRIEKILNIFNELPLKSITIKELSKKVFLSESRLIHLFTNQVGISIRHYLLWLRLLDAIKLIIKGKSITFAAYEVGFSDSAHLSRTFRRMFGLKLFEVFKNYKNSHFVQVRTENY